jgi:hypothetical protein
MKELVKVIACGAITGLVLSMFLVPVVGEKLENYMIHEALMESGIVEDMEDRGFNYMGSYTNGDDEICDVFTYGSDTAMVIESNGETTVITEKDKGSDLYHEIRDGLYLH